MTSTPLGPKYFLYSSLLQSEWRTQISAVFIKLYNNIKLTDVTTEDDNDDDDDDDVRSYL